MTTIFLIIIGVLLIFCFIEGYLIYCISQDSISNKEQKEKITRLFQIEKDKNFQLQNQNERLNDENKSIWETIKKNPISTTDDVLRILRND